MLEAHWVGVASDIAIMSLLALSAYVMLLIGRISFGQQAFFGLGAYSSAIASTMLGLPLLAALLAGVLVGAIVSLLIAAPTMRLSGLHYAVATLAFGEMVHIALGAWHWQININDSVVGPAGLDGFRDIRWLLTNDVSDFAYLLFACVVLLFVLLTIFFLERRRYGTALRMIGHDDTLAVTQGLPIDRIRLSAAAIAGGLAALSGGLYAHRTTYIEPTLFDPMLGVHAVGYALIGGLGSPIGPLLGVSLDVGLLQASSVFSGWRMVVFGGLVAIFLRWRPRGILDEALVHRIKQRWTKHHA
jgi:branched-chain amino acid transport system permease protein